MQCVIAYGIYCTLKGYLLFVGPRLCCNVKVVEHFIDTSSSDHIHIKKLTDILHLLVLCIIVSEVILL